MHIYGIGNCTEARIGGEMTPLGKNEAHAEVGEKREQDSLRALMGRAADLIGLAKEVLEVAPESDVVGSDCWTWRHQAGEWQREFRTIVEAALAETAQGSSSIDQRATGEQMDLRERSEQGRKQGIREWLLAGGGGFEGTPEASNFSFEGMIDYIDAFAQLACDGLVKRLASSREAAPTLTADELRSCVFTFADGGMNFDVTLQRINNFLRKKLAAARGC
jgi:hypothetical protein